MLVALIVLAAAVYAPVREASFIYEDDHVQDHPVAWSEWSHVPGRALTNWTLLQAPGPASAHLMNLGLHLVAGVLVAAVTLELAGSLAAVMAAGAHLLHPLNSQAVAYVMGRPELLMTIGILLAVWAALQRGAWRFPVIVAGLLFAASSKEIGVIGVPLVVVTLLVWRPADVQRHSTAALWVCSGAVIGRAWASVTNWISLVPGGGGPDVPWTEFVVRQLGLTWALLLRLIWPTGLSIDHDALSLGPLWLLLATLLTIQAAVVAAWSWRRRPLLAWAITWVAVALAPRLVIGSNEFLAERHLYLPLVGVSIWFGALTARWLTTPSEDASFWTLTDAHYRASFPSPCKG